MNNTQRILTISWDIAKRNFLQRYRGNAMGAIWILLNPLLMMLLYTVVFGYIFKGKYSNRAEGSTVDYALGIFFGIVVLHWITETIANSVNVIQANSNLVKKVVFPLDALPISVFIESSINFVIGVFIAFVASLILGYHSLLQLWMIPLVLIGMLMCLGVAFFVSSIGPFFRDLTHLMGFISLFLLNASAVFFSISAIPEELSFVIPLNPIMHLVESTRSVMLWGVAPEMYSIGVLSIWAVFIFIIGIFFFRSVKPIFADVV